MSHPTFEIPPYFDYGATFLWALSGALLAARKGYAIPGILIVSFVSSVGGGLLRDGLFLQNGPPLVVRTPGYLGLIGVAVVLILLLGGRIQRLRRLPHLISLVDAIALLGCLLFVAQVSYGIRSKPLPAFRKSWDQPEGK